MDQSQKTKKVTPKENTPDQEKKFNAIAQATNIPNGEKIIDQFKKGNISQDVIDEIYELRLDRKKTKTTAFKDYFKALGNGKIPKGRTLNQREYAMAFLEALSGNEEQKAYAKDTLASLADSPEGALSKGAIESHIDRLDELKETKVEDALTHVERSQVANEANEASKIEIENWKVKMLPPEVQEKLSNNEVIYLQTMLEGNQKDEELKQETDPTKIEQLKSELRDIDQKVHELEQETKPVVTNFLKSRLRQFRAIHSLPININFAEKLSSLAFSTEDSEKSKAVKLILKSDPATGETAPVRKTIEVVGIKFDDQDPNIERPDDSAHPMQILIKDENGESQKISRIAFIDMVNAFEIYEEVETLDDLNKKVREQTFHTNLQEGQTFFRSNTETGEEEEFKIQQIAEDENGKPKIILNKPIVNVPRAWQSDSAAHDLHFDRINSQYEPGEFAKLLKQKEFRLDVPRKDVAATLEKMSSAQKKGAAEYTKNATGQAKERLEKITERDRSPISPSDIESKLSRMPKTAETPQEERKNIANFLQAESAADANTAPPQIDTDLGPSMNKASERVEPEGTDMEKIPGPPAYKEEALAYEDINKVGGMTVDEKGFIKDLWAQSRFLSVSDIWEMGKTMYEYHQRRFERRQKERYSSIAKELPYFGPEMKRINQAEENQNVSDFKEAMDQQGIFSIQDILRTTKNQDEMKAALSTLCEKGQMRWDDIAFWDNLNRFITINEFKIPIPANGDPYTKMSDADQRTGFDFHKGAVDHIWGDGTYDDWFSQNNSQFDSGVQAAGQEGNMLEGLDGGHQRRLSDLLRQHKMGEYVNPQRYEGLILHMINNGKASMHDKLYYIVQGLGAVNSQGRTILAFERLGQINTAMLTKFPMLEYMTASVKREDGGSHKWTKDDYKEWANYFDGGDSSNPAANRPGAHVHKFLWKYAIPSDETRTRINKVARNFQELDHDDMFAYLPPATERIIEDACKVQSGTRKYLTIEGYKNVFAGYSEYFKQLTSNSNAQRLLEAVKGYAMFEGIMENRYARGQEYQRMNSDEMRSTPVMGDTSVGEYISQMKPMIAEIVRDINDTQLSAYYNLMTTEDVDVNTSNGQDKQKEIDTAFTKFGTRLEKAMDEKGRAKCYQIILNAAEKHTPQMKGMQFKSFEERLAAQQAAIEEAKAKGN